MRERINRKKKNPKRLFLVICEGETEGAYIDILRRHYRLPIEIRSKITGNRVNSRLVKQYLVELGVTSRNDYRVFYIYDMDVEQIVHNLQTLEGLPIMSNPCIEFWFLLHSTSHKSHISSEKARQLLVKVAPEWATYRKGVLTLSQRNLLISKTPDAVTRARDLSYPQNPSSNMHDLIAILEEEKKG